MYNLFALFYLHCFKQIFFIIIRLIIKRSIMDQELFVNVTKYKNFISLERTSFP